MTKFLKPSKREMERLAEIGKKTIKQEDRKEREPREPGGFHVRQSFRD